MMSELISEQLIRYLETSLLKRTAWRERGEKRRRLNYQPNYQLNHQPEPPDHPKRGRDQLVSRSKKLSKGMSSVPDRWLMRWRVERLQVPH
jgi:hypothetical protein